MPENTTITDLMKQFGTDPHNGLSKDQYQTNYAKYGDNKLKSEKHLNFFQKFLLQLKDYMVIILLMAAVISFVIALLEQNGEYIDAIIILAIVLLNGILGVQQESKAEKALDALKDMSAPSAKVLREGIASIVPAAAVVPGDIVLLEAGDFVPADGRLIESASLKCEESSLTGESIPVEKFANAVVAADAPIGDRINMAYSGCAVSYGRAKLLVTKTGMHTEMGKIAGLLSGAKSEMTPLQIKLNQLGKYLGILAIAICALIFGVGLLQGLPPMTMFMTSVSLAVAAIPEGLTAVVTVVLAVGVQKMVKKNAIIRRLPAVETLGSASVICSDKTGTLTQNRMTVQQVWAVGEQTSLDMDALPEKALHVVRLATMCNDGRIEDSQGLEQHIGDPTETAIIAVAKKNGIQKTELDCAYCRVAEIPFDSDRKLMTTVNMVNGRVLVVVKGGFDVLLPLCPGADPKAAEAINLSMSRDALRVIAVACKEISDMPKDISHASLESDLTFIGLIGMIDPPREESKQAVSLCRDAGIKTVMITGDHVATASAIAKELGILESDDQATTGTALLQMSQQDLERDVEKYRVYARVSPEDKIRIVKAWQSKHAVVAMTGDGVNDAPALKAADIGCAMGITGTDVAKGAADMVLTDDNFSTIVESVKSGRGIYENITRTIQFLLGSNLGEIFTVLVAMLMGWGTPLLAIHLLLVNIVTDALPALALGVEPTRDDVMKRNPIPKNQGIFADKLGLIIVLQGIMVGILTLSGFYIGKFVGVSPHFTASHEIGMTMAFLILSLSQLVQAMNCRSRKSLFNIGFTSNKQMLLAVIGSAAVIFAVFLISPLKSIFRMVDMSMMHWVAVIALSIAPFFIVELVKLCSKPFQRA